MESNDSKNKSTRRIIVVAVIVLSIIPLVISINFIWLFNEIKFNQDKWQGFEITDYQITTKLDDFSEISGTYKLDVKNGEVSQLTALHAYWPDAVHPPEDYYELTVDGLFQKAYSCVSHYLSYWCSIRFDPQYGYPTEIHINCDNADICAEDVTVLDMKLLPK